MLEMSYHHQYCTVFFMIIIISGTSFVNGEELLPIMLVTSSFDGFNTSSVAETALATAINRVTTTVLPQGYRLSTGAVIDSKCDTELTAKLLHQELQYPKEDGTVLAIIGCGCPNATRAIAELRDNTNFTNIPVVSYGSQSVEFGNPLLYPMLFETIPTFHGVQDAIVGFIKHFKWKRVFYFSEAIGIVYQKLDESFNSSGIQLFRKDIKDISLSFQNERIFLVDAYETNVRHLLCEAYINGLYYPTHVWILIDNFINDDWYTVPDTPCSLSEIHRVLDYSILLGTSPGNSERELWTYVYDAVLGIALGFRELIQTNGQAIANHSLIDQMKALSFNGLSRHIQWNIADDSNITDVSAIMTQFYSGSSHIIGSYTNGILTLNESTSIWPQGTPTDGPIIIVIEAVKIWGFVLSVVICVSGITWALICFIFIWIHRQKKVIKLTSPTLNYIIIIGSCSAFLSNVAYSIPTNDVDILKYICPFQPFLVTVFGYNICVTVATIKLWRIHFIFKDPKLSKRAPKDWQLLMVLGLHVAIYFAVVGAMVITDAILYPPKVIRSSTPDEIDTETGQLRTHYYIDCRTNSIFARIYYAITLGNIFLMHAVGLLFAFRTRKIKIVVLNEYKYILVYLLLSIVISFIGIVILGLVNRNQTLFAVSISIYVSTICFIFLALTFVPKMIALKRDPKGEQLFRITDIHDARGMPTQAPKQQLPDSPDNKEPNGELNVINSASSTKVAVV